MSTSEERNSLLIHRKNLMNTNVKLSMSILLYLTL